MRSPGLIILAAGASSRMGRPKQLLPWRGRTLLRHACETATAVPLRPIIVVLGCEAESCQRELAGLDVVSVVNPDWPRGMGASVATGVKALQKMDADAPGALIMLVDQPSVTPAHLASLFSQWSEQRCPIAATDYEEGGGVPALFSRRFFPELSSLTTDRGARQIIVREKKSASFLKPGAPLVDLDTPEVYAASSAMGKSC